MAPTRNIQFWKAQNRGQNKGQNKRRDKKPSACGTKTCGTRVSESVEQGSLEQESVKQMKAIGLVPEFKRSDLESLLRLWTKKKSRWAKWKERREVNQFSINQFSINISNPEYNSSNSGANLAGVICLSFQFGSELGIGSEAGVSKTEPVPEAKLSEVRPVPQNLLDLLKSGGAEDIYIVQERRYWGMPATRQYGEPSPGINRITFVKRRSGISAAEFSQLWDNHSAIAKEHHPGISGYTQNVVIEKLSGDDLNSDNLNAGSMSDANKETGGVGGTDIPFGFDGIAELYFNSAQDMEQKMYKDETSQEIVFSDIRRFLDIEAGNRIFATQYVLKDGKF